MKITTSTLVTLILFFISIKLFFDHRDEEYKGPYKYYGNYQNVSGTKHDAFKFAFLVLFVFIVVGLPEGVKWWDSENIFESGVGRIMAVIMAVFVYHELVLPYTVNFLPPW